MWLTTLSFRTLAERTNAKEASDRTQMRVAGALMFVAALVSSLSRA
jgi:hypothetical protein